MSYPTYSDQRLATYRLDFLSDAPKPLHAFAPFHAYERLQSGQQSNYSIQRIMPESFRLEIADALKCDAWQASNLSDIDLSKVSCAWKHAANMRASYNTLDIDQKISLINLLVAMGMHKDVLALVSTSEVSNVGDSKISELAFLRAVSQITMHYDYGDAFDTEALLNLMHKAPKDDMARIRAAHALVVHNSKAGGNLNLARNAAKVMRKAVTDRELNEPIDTHLLISRLYRGISMVPLMERDNAEMVRQMDKAEWHARAAIDIAKTDRQRLASAENLMTVLESRTKEALFIKDLGLARKRSAEQLMLDPLDPKNHIEFGEVLFKCGSYEEARVAFRTASALGPPGVAVALYLAGLASEHLGETQVAADYYRQTLAIDPEGVSALERLSDLGDKINVPGMEQWISTRRKELEDAH